MRFSDETLSVFKSFSSINPSLLIKANDPKVMVMDASMSMFGKATLPDNELGKHDMAIYDVPQFLSTLGMMDTYDIEQTDEHYATIKYPNGATMRWMYAHPAVVNAPSKDITMPPMHVHFKLSAENLTSVLKVAASAAMTNLIITKGGKENTVDLTVTNMDTQSSNESSNKWTLNIPGEVPDGMGDFTVIFYINNIARMLKVDYDVSISAKKIARFAHASDALNVEYILTFALESVIEDPDNELEAE